MHRHFNHFEIIRMWRQRKVHRLGEAVRRLVGDGEDSCGGVDGREEEHALGIMCDCDVLVCRGVVVVGVLLYMQHHESPVVGKAMFCHLDFFELDRSQRFDGVDVDFVDLHNCYGGGFVLQVVQGYLLLSEVSRYKWSSAILGWQSPTSLSAS